MATHAVYKEDGFDEKYGKMFTALLFIIATFRLAKVNAEVAKPEITNIAKDLLVISRGSGHTSITDKKTWIGFEAVDSTFPEAYVDLKAVYHIESMSIWGQYRHGKGIHHPFNIYTWHKHEGLCQLNQYYPWHLCAENVTFTHSKQKLHITCLPEAREAQYIIFTRGYPENIQIIPGMAIYELEVMGYKLRDDNFTLPSFDDTPIKDIYELTKRELLEGSMGWNPRVLGAKLRFHPNHLYVDVVFMYEVEYYAGIAGTRDQGRVVMISGQRWWDLLYNQKRDKGVLESMRKWLSKGNEEAPTVEIGNKFKISGDILIIRCPDNFDVDQTEKDIRSGKHPAFLVIADECESVDERPFMRLLKRLDIRYVVLGRPHRDFYAWPGYIIQQKIQESLKYAFELVTKSWYNFRNIDYFSQFINLKPSVLKQLSSPETQESLRKAIEHYRPYFEENSPCLASPLHRNSSTITAYVNYNTMHFGQIGQSVFVLPAIDDNPGMVKENRSPDKIRVAIKGGVNSIFQPLGVYAKAGEAFSWMVINSSVPVSSVKMRVNCRNDVVSHVQNQPRWPSIAHTRPLAESGSWASPVGGPIYLDLPSGGELVIEVDGAYRYPWVDVRDPSTLDNWEINKKRYGGIPLMHISGDIFHTCLPFKDVARSSTDDLKYVTTYYDKMVKTMHNYRGTDWRKARHEIMVTDQVISHGEAHAGYPFMASIYWTQWYLDRKLLKPGERIGIIHEVGHNLQTRPTYLMNGVETTNNVFISVTQGHLHKVDMFQMNHSFALQKNDVKNLAKQMNTTFTGFTIHWYVYFSHIFGEGLIGNTWRKMNNQKNAPTDVHGSIQNFVNTTSQKIGHNLVPFYRLWNVAIDDATKEAVKDLKCFIPDDSCTRQNPAAVERVIKEYGGECFRGPIEKAKPEVDYEDGWYENRPPAVKIEVL